VQTIGPRLRAIALSRAGRYIVSALAVGIASAAFQAVRGILGKDVVALLFVPIIIATAGLTGRRGWWFTPVLSFLSLDYFFTPPIYSLHVADPHDWLLLGIFLVVGLVSSLEVGRLHERTREATGRQHDLLVLNRLSRNLVSEASAEEMASLIGLAVRDSAERILLMVSASGTQEDLRPVDGVPSDVEMDVARWVFTNGRAVGLPTASSVEPADEPWPISTRWPAGLSGPCRGLYLPLQSSVGRPQGVLLFDTPPSPPPTGDQVRLFVSMANLAAAFLERAQLQAKETALASLEEADRLKSSFISAVSHDIKTPLAAAKARVTGLLEDDIQCDDRLQRQELTAVATNLDRLDITIGDLMDLSRLESDAWRPRPEPHEVGEILSTMLSHLPQGSRERVSVRLPGTASPVTVDFKQLERALRNLVENALTYSDGDVVVTVEMEPAEMTVTVEDRGPGIPLAEREHVFEPFFRGSTGRGAASGTGLGLAITREIVHAHDGGIRIEDGEPWGTRFVISLPTKARNDGCS